MLFHLILSTKGLIPFFTYEEIEVSNLPREHTKQVHGSLPPNSEILNFVSFVASLCHLLFIGSKTLDVSCPSVGPCWHSVIFLLVIFLCISGPKSALQIFILLFQHYKVSIFLYCEIFLKYNFQWLNSIQFYDYNKICLAIPLILGKLNAFNILLLLVTTVLFLKQIY